MTKTSPQINSILLIATLFFGSIGGFLFQNYRTNEIIQDKQESIDSQAILLSQKDQYISELEDNLNEYNTTITNQLIELENLKEELSEIIQAAENEPDLILDLEERIIELEKDIQENNFEIIRLKTRLGDRLNWKKYQNHDFSFEYPDWMDLSIIDNGYYEGAILSINWIDPVNFFSYQWQDIKSMEEAVESYIEENDDMEFIIREIIPTEVYGHNAYMYLYNVTIGDGSYHGVMCVWECSDTDRVNILFQYSSEDPLTSFIQILGTFKCHVEGEPT